MVEDKPKILLIADVPGWAFDTICQGIKHYLSEYYHFDIVYENQINSIDLKQYDLIHLHSSWKHFLLQNLPKEILVTTIHGYFEIEHIYPPGYVDQIPERFSAVSVVCKGLKGFIRQFVPHVSVTSAGVETDQFYPVEKFAKPNFVVGWAGSIDNHHGNARVRELMQPAVERAGCDLILAAREQNFITHENMPEFYQNLDCYVCTSRTEGHPLSVLEAASCGIPILSTPVGIVRELVENGTNGLIVEPTVDSVSGAITRLRDNPDMVAKMGRAIRQTVLEKWSWQIRSKAFKQFYDSVLSESIHHSRKRNIQWWIDHGGSEWLEEVRRGDKEHGHYSKQESENERFFKDRIPPGWSVLEVGCGYGRMLQSLCDGRSGFSVGLDRSMLMLQQAKSYLGLSFFSKLILGDARRLPIVDKSFDVTFTSDFLIHTDFDDIKKVVLELVRVSRKCIIHFENKTVDEPSFVSNWHDGCWAHDYKELYGRLGYITDIIHQDEIAKDIYVVKLNKDEANHYVKIQRKGGANALKNPTSIGYANRNISYNQYQTNTTIHRNFTHNFLPLLSIIIPFRQREIWRIENSLKSLRSQDRNSQIPIPEIIVVDYSPIINDPALLECLSKSDATYVGYKTTNIWNRAHALNIGIRNASGYCILCTDTDIIFPKDFLQLVYDQFQINGENIFIICSVRDIPYSLVSGPISIEKEFDALLRESQQRGHLATGGCQISRRRWLYKVRAYDQKFVWWGGEDDDMYYRAIMDGLKIIDLSDQTSFLHQWHPNVWHLAENRNNLHLHAHNVRHLHQMYNLKIIQRNDPNWGF